MSRARSKRFKEPRTEQAIQGAAHGVSELSNLAWIDYNFKPVTKFAIQEAAHEVSVRRSRAE